MFGRGECCCIAILIVWCIGMVSFATSDTLSINGWLAAAGTAAIMKACTFTSWEHLYKVGLADTELSERSLKWNVPPKLYFVLVRFLALWGAYATILQAMGACYLHQDKFGVSLPEGVASLSGWMTTTFVLGIVCAGIADWFAMDHTVNGKALLRFFIDMESLEQWKSALASDPFIDKVVGHLGSINRRLQASNGEQWADVQQWAQQFRTLKDEISQPDEGDVNQHEKINNRWIAKNLWSNVFRLSGTTLWSVFEQFELKGGNTLVYASNDPHYMCFGLFPIGSTSDFIYFAAIAQMVAATIVCGLLFMVLWFGRNFKFGGQVLCMKSILGTLLILNVVFVSPYTFFDIFNGATSFQHAVRLGCTADMCTTAVATKSSIPTYSEQEKDRLLTAKTRLGYTNKLTQRLKEADAPEELQSIAQAIASSLQAHVAELTESLDAPRGTELAGPSW